MGMPQRSPTSAAADPHRPAGVAAPRRIRPATFNRPRPVLRRGPGRL